MISGLYRATDKGWELLPAPSFYSVTAAPDGTIYIYAGDFNIYRSTDDGETWELAGDDIPAGGGTSIFPSPVPDMVFLGVPDLPFTPGARGIYKSIDGGATWEKVLEGGNGAWVDFSPNFAEDGTAFAALNEYKTSLGIWRTEDWGETWGKKSDGLAYGFTLGGHGWVKVSPQYPQDGTVFTADATGAYKTTDGGESWFLLSDRVGGLMTLSPNYINDQTILAAGAQPLKLSQDGGESWETLFEYYTEAAGIRIPGPFGGPAPPPAPPPGSHILYFPLVGHRMDDTMLEFWLVQGRPVGNGIECYLYRSYDLGATWEEMFVYEPTHWYYFPIVATGSDAS